MVGRRILTGLLALFFAVAGTMHFLRPGMYVQIMPPYVPWHLPLVYATGAWEIAAGLAVLVPPWRRAAGLALLVLLAVVFPANVHMAVHQVPLDGRTFPPVLLWLRLPVQGVLAAWVWWCTRPRD